MKYLKLVVALLLCLYIQQTLSAKNLIFVQQLFRHGARYPIFPRRNTDKTDYVLDEGKTGELTTQGKKMHYLLGQAVREAYWTKIFPNPIYNQGFNNTKFYFKTTDVNRTYDSLNSHLMGIFENLPTLTINSSQTNYSKPLWPNIFVAQGDVFTSAPKYHPIPIHAEKIGSAYNDGGDFLRAYSPQNCPKQDNWVVQNQGSTFAKMVYKDQNFVKALAQLSKALNRTQNNPVTFQQQGYFYDNYQCNLYLGKPFLPIFEDPKYKRDLYYIYTLDLYINLFYNDLQIRTTSSGFFQATLANIQRAINKRDVQWVIYSAHDTTVANMLAAMNMTNAACIYEAYKKGDKYNNETCVVDYPGFTANIIFEVYENNQTQLTTFKIRYLGEYRKIPFCDYKQQCPVSRLQYWFNHELKVSSFSANCGLFNQDKQFYKGIAIIQFGIILAFGIYWIVKHMKHPKPLVKPSTQKQAEAEISMVNKTLLKEETGQLD